MMASGETKPRRAIAIEYADDNLVIAVKPQGIETTSVGVDKKQNKTGGAAGSNSAPKTFHTLLEAELKIKLFAVHRLDTNTEGLIIFAKTPIAQKELERAFKDGEIKKTYEAVCDLEKSTISIAALKSRGGVTLDGWLTKDSTRGLVRITNKKLPGAQKCVTVVRFARALGGLSLLEINPQTGRTHQIRAHLASCGISILGDGKYGDFKLNRDYNQKRQQLFATKIEFALAPTSPLFYLNAAAHPKHTPNLAVPS